jgi:holo-[acyl-carrier protein] synthase
MITGIGTDIVTIARLTGLHARHGQRAVARLLSARECAEFAGTRDPGRFLAKRFAAKEAFGKALGTGLIARRRCRTSVSHMMRWAGRFSSTQRR